MHSDGNLSHVSKQEMETNYKSLPHATTQIILMHYTSDITFVWWGFE